MAKILFVNSNLHGHIHPTLPLVQELVNRGNPIHYMCSRQFEAMVTAAGAEFLYFGESLEEFLSAYKPTDRHPFFMLMEYVLQYDEVLLPGLIAHIKEEKYDAVICDSIFGAQYFLRQLLSVPVICSHSSFAMSHAPVPEYMLVPGYHRQLDACYLVLKRICARYQMEEPGLDDLFVSKGQLNIVYTTKEFNGDDQLDDSCYVFAGPSIRGREAAEDSEQSAYLLERMKEKKVIYISLGTINTDFIDFFKMCFAAFTGTEYVVVLSIGNKCDIAQLGEIPSNFIVLPYAPQLTVLRHASVFISHGGFNSVNEALYYGVPIAAIPMVNDQFMTAKRLTALEAGLLLKMDQVTADSLRNCVNTIETSDVIHKNCQRLSRDMRKTASHPAAADRIENWIGEGKNGTQK